MGRPRTGQFSQALEDMKSEGNNWEDKGKQILREKGSDWRLLVSLSL
jgi:hypothetical protein